MKKSQPGDSEILDRLAPIVARSLRIDRAQVTPDAHLDDLGAESLDLVEISLDTEEEFRISLPEKNVFEVAREVFGEDVLEKEGVLTEEGKKFLVWRMPELDISTLGNRIAVDDLQHLFLNVGTWIRMIRGLMAHTPQECPQCGVAFTEAKAGLLKCKQCSHEVEIPYGDEISRQSVKEYYESEYLPAQASSKSD